MPKKTIIIGHKSPDTDAIVSVLVFAKLLGDFALAARAGEINKETKFVLSFFKEKQPVLVKSLKNKKVFLLDHNNPEEAVDGFEQAELVGVIDHHYLSGIQTSSPIYYRAEPIGSSSTIIAKIFKEKNIKLTKKQAGLLLAGVISDTLLFTSPTCTEEDRKIAKELTRISGVKPKELAQKMFKAKSDITGISISALVVKDYKEFKSGNTRFGIGVWETTLPEAVKAKKEQIFPALEKKKETAKLDFIFFALVDIVRQKSELFLLDKEKKVAEKVFKGEILNNLMLLKGVVSRKKQILPPLVRYFSKK